MPCTSDDANLGPATRRYHHHRRELALRHLGRRRTSFHENACGRLRDRMGIAQARRGGSHAVMIQARRDESRAICISKRRQTAPAAFPEGVSACGDYSRSGVIQLIARDASAMPSHRVGLLGSIPAVSTTACRLRFFVDASHQRDVPRTHSPVSGLRKPQLSVLLGDTFHYRARGAGDFVSPAKAALEFAQLRKEIGFECRSRADRANRRVISSASEHRIHGQAAHLFTTCGPAQRPGNSRWA